MDIIINRNNMKDYIKNLWLHSTEEGQNYLEIREQIMIKSVPWIAEALNELGINKVIISSSQSDIAKIIYILCQKGYTLKGVDRIEHKYGNAYDETGKEYEDGKTYLEVFVLSRQDIEKEK